MKTQEEIIADIENNLETLTPRTVSDYSVYLAVYLTRLSEEWAIAENTSNKRWKEIRETSDTDGQANKRLQSTNEYAIARSLELAISSLKELIKTLKIRLRMLSDEANMRT